MFDPGIPLQITPLHLVLIFIVGALIGIVIYRLYQSRLIRYLPQTAPLKLEAFFCEGKHINERDTHLSLIIKATNSGHEVYHFESWFVRALNGRGNLRQLFQFPQNFVRTLRPNEATTIEVQSLEFLEGQELYTICLRDIYGREWQVSRDNITNLKKDYFWQSLT